MNNFTTHLKRFGAVLVLLLLAGSTSALAQPYYVLVDPVNGDENGGALFDEAVDGDADLVIEEEDFPAAVAMTDVFKYLEDAEEECRNDTPCTIFVVNGLYPDDPDDGDDVIDIEDDPHDGGLTIRSWTFDDYDTDDEEYEGIALDVPATARINTDLFFDIDRDLGTNTQLVVTLGANLLFALNGNQDLTLNVDEDDTDVGNLTFTGPGVFGAVGSGGNANIFVPRSGYNNYVSDESFSDHGGLAFRNFLVDKSDGGVNIGSVVPPTGLDEDVVTTVKFYNRFAVNRGNVTVGTEIDLFYILIDAGDVLGFGFDSDLADEFGDEFAEPNGDNTNTDGAARSNETALWIDDGRIVAGDGVFRISTDGYDQPFPDTHFYTTGQGLLNMNVRHEGSPDMELSGDGVFDKVGGNGFENWATVIGFPVFGAGQASENRLGYLVVANEDGTVIEGGFRAQPNTYTSMERVTEILGDFHNFGAYVEFLTGPVIEGEFIFRDEICFPEFFEDAPALKNAPANVAGEEFRCQPVQLLAVDTHLGTDPSSGGDLVVNYGQEGLENFAPVPEADEGDGGMTRVEGDALLDTDQYSSVGDDEDVLDLPAIILEDSHNLDLVGDLIVFRSPVDLINSGEDDTDVLGLTMWVCSDEFLVFRGDDDDDDEGTFWDNAGILDDDDTGQQEVFFYTDFEAERVRIALEEDDDIEFDRYNDAVFTIVEHLDLENGEADFDEDEMLAFGGNLLITREQGGSLEADDFLGAPAQITYTVGDDGASYSIGDEAGAGAGVIVVLMDGFQLNNTMNLNVGTFMLLSGLFNQNDFQLNIGATGEGTCDVDEDGDVSGDCEPLDTGTFVQGNGGFTDPLQPSGVVQYVGDFNHLIYTNTLPRQTTDTEFPLPSEGRGVLDRVTLRPFLTIDAEGDTVRDYYADYGESDNDGATDFNGDPITCTSDEDPCVKLNGDKELAEDVQVWYGTLEMVTYDVSFGNDLEINTLYRVAQTYGSVCTPALFEAIGPNYSAEVLGEAGGGDAGKQTVVDNAAEFISTGSGFFLSHIENSGVWDPSRTVISVPNLTAAGSYLGILLNEGWDDGSFLQFTEGHLDIDQAGGNLNHLSGTVENADGSWDYWIGAATDINLNTTAAAATYFRDLAIRSSSDYDEDDFEDEDDYFDECGDNLDNLTQKAQGGVSGPPETNPDAFDVQCEVENRLTSHDGTGFAFINNTFTEASVFTPRFTTRIEGDWNIVVDDVLDADGWFEDNVGYYELRGDFTANGGSGAGKVAGASTTVTKFGGTVEFDGSEVQNIWTRENCDSGDPDTPECARSEYQGVAFHSLRVNNAAGVKGLTNVTVGEDHDRDDPESTGDLDIYDVFDYFGFNGNFFVADLAVVDLCTVFEDCEDFVEFSQPGELILTLGHLQSGECISGDGTGKAAGVDPEACGSDGTDVPRYDKTVYVTNDDAAQISSNGQVLFGAIWEGNNLSWVEGNLNREFIERGVYIFPFGQEVSGVGHYSPGRLIFSGQQGQTRNATGFFTPGVPPGDAGLPVEIEEDDLSLGTLAPMSWTFVYDGQSALETDVQLTARGLAELSTEDVFQQVGEETIDLMRIIQRQGGNAADAWHNTGVFDDKPTAIDGDPNNSNDFVNGAETFNQEGIRDLDAAANTWGNTGAPNWMAAFNGATGLGQTFTIGADPSVIPPVAFAQLIHCAEGAGAVDVWVNGELVATLDEQTATPYLGLHSLSNDVDLYEAGTDTPIMEDLELTVNEGEAVVVLVSGATPDDVYVIRDARRTATVDDKVDLIFVHNSAGAPAVVDIRALDPFDNNVPVGVFVNNLAFGEASNYIGLEPSTRNLEITDDADGSVVEVFLFQLNGYSGQSLTFFFCGGELVGVDAAGNFIRGDITTDTEEPGTSELPTEFALDGNYPNPFNPSTTIQFDLPETAEVSIQVIDVLGRQVLTVPTQVMEAGSNRTLQVDAASLASGTYIYRILAQTATETMVKTGRMTLIK